MHDFVILRHDLPPADIRDSHWDFMLQSGEELLTWALSQNPLTCQYVAGRQIANHRLEYLEFEGPISGNRGVVTRVARGQFEWVDKIDDGNWTILLKIDNDLRMRCDLKSNRMFHFQYLDQSAETES